MPFAKVESCSRLLPQREKAAAKWSREPAASRSRFGAGPRGAVLPCCWKESPAAAACCLQHPLLCGLGSTFLCRGAAADPAFCVPPKQTPCWRSIPAVLFACVRQ